MSVILLTAPPHMLANIRMRDPNATLIHNSILGLRTAIVCKETIKALYGGKTSHVANVKRSTLSIGNNWILKIVHDTSIMGPPGFINVGFGDHTCPWGIWTLYKENNFECKLLTMQEAEEGYHLAKAYTHKENPKTTWWLYPGNDHLKKRDPKTLTFSKN